MWDRALVVVTADHGIGLRPTGSRREVVHSDFAAIAGVPPLAAQPRTTNATTPVQVRHGRTKKLVSVPFGQFVRARDAELARQRRSFPDGLRSL